MTSRKHVLTAWLKEAATEAERVRRNQSNFLLYTHRAGRQADFHVGTLCTRMHKAGVPLATEMRITGRRGVARG